MTQPLDPFSEVLDERRRWKPDWYSWLTRLAAPPFLKVSELPPIADPSDRAFATDATTTVFGSVVVGGGTNRVPVYFDGTNWSIG